MKKKFLIQAGIVFVFMCSLISYGIYDTNTNWNTDTDVLALENTGYLPTAGVTNVFYDNLNLNTDKVATLSENDVIEVAAANDLVTDIATTNETESIEFTEDDLAPSFIVTDIDTKTMWVTSSLNVRVSPEKESEKLGSLNVSDTVTVTGIVENTNWVRINYKDTDCYVSATYLSDTEPSLSIPTDTTQQIAYNYSGAVLNPSNGRVQGPSGEETYYNMNMSYIVNRLHQRGFEGEYWVRADGCKMFGDYILVAANFDIRPIGTIVETSLGLGIVADTGSFVNHNPYGLDIATTW